jgi:hypothetical protein
MSGSVGCIGSHIMMLNQHVAGLQQAQKRIKQKKRAADHPDVKEFLLHAARIRAAADQLLHEGLITHGQAIVDGCCGLDNAGKEKKAARKK